MTIFNQNQLDQLAELLIASSSEIALACQNAECDVQKEIGKLGGAINMGKEFPNEPMAEIFEFIKAKDEYINWVIDKFINYYQSEESPLDLLEKCRKALFGVFLGQGSAGTHCVPCVFGIFGSRSKLHMKMYILHCFNMFFDSSMQNHAEPL